MPGKRCNSNVKLARHGLNMVAMDLVEVSPPYDHAEITALAAATVTYDWLCVMAQRRQQGLW